MSQAGVIVWCADIVEACNGKMLYGNGELELDGTTARPGRESLAPHVSCLPTDTAGKRWLFVDVCSPIYGRRLSEQPILPVMSISVVFKLLKPYLPQ